MRVVLSEPALLTVALAAIGGYAGWQLGRRIMPLRAAATTAAALGAAWLIYQTFEGSIPLYRASAGASLGEALMTFVPIPLAIAATAIVAFAGVRRDDRPRSGVSPVAGAPDAAASSEGLGR